MNEHVPFWVGGRSRRSLAAGGGARRRLGAVRAQARRPRRLARRGGAPRRVRGGRAAGRRRRSRRRARARSDELLARVGRAPARPSSTCTSSTTRSSTTSSSSTRSPRERASAVGLLLADVGSRSAATTPPTCAGTSSTTCPSSTRSPGIRLGTRWRADDECVGAASRRRPTTSRRSATPSATCMTDPVEETLTAFARLGRRLAEAGRYPEPATPHLLGAFELHGAHAAPAARGVGRRRPVPAAPRRVPDRRAARRGRRGVDALVAVARRRSTSPPSSPTDGRRRRATRSAARRGWARAPTRGRGSARPRRGTPAAASSRSCTSTATSRTPPARLDPLVRRGGRDGAVAPRLAGPVPQPRRLRGLASRARRLLRCASAWSAPTR